MPKWSIAASASAIAFGAFGIGALIACGGSRFEGEQDASTQTPDGSPDSTIVDGGANADTATVDGTAPDTGENLDAGRDATNDDSALGACASPAAACHPDAQAVCAPSCGQWPGTKQCAPDCTGFGACAVDDFSWQSSAADGGFLHQCTGAIDQYGNWQTTYTATPNGCLAQYGPYLQVPRGAYDASIQVWGTADSVVVTVTNHNGANILQASGTTSLSNGWTKVAVPSFRVDDDACTGVELRVTWVSATGVAIVVGPSSLVRTGP